MQTLFNILMALIVLAILATLVYNLTGTELREGYLFSAPNQCSTICARTPYKNYCNNNYFSDGSACQCNCQWQNGQCVNV